MGQADDRVNWIYYNSVGRASDQNVRRDTDCAGSSLQCGRLFCFVFAAGITRLVVEKSERRMTASVLKQDPNK